MTKLKKPWLVDRFFLLPLWVTVPNKMIELTCIHMEKNLVAFHQKGFIPTKWNNEKNGKIMHKLLSVIHQIRWNNSIQWRTIGKGQQQQMQRRQNHLCLPTINNTRAGFFFIFVLCFLSIVSSSLRLFSSISWSWRRKKEERNISSLLIIASLPFTIALLSPSIGLFFLNIRFEKRFFTILQIATTNGTIPLNLPLCKRFLLAEYAILQHTNVRHTVPINLTQ